MEIVALVVIAVLAYLLFLGMKFSGFKSKLMNEFGRRGISYDVADNIYFQRRDAINNWHHEGVQITEIVQRCLEQSESREPSARASETTPQKEGVGQSSPQDQSAGGHAAVKKNQAAAIIEFVSGTLSIQQALMLGDDEELPEEAWDNWSLGYVAGTVDAVLQQNGFELDAEGMAIMTMVFMEVFGQDAGPGFLGNFMRLQDSGDRDLETGMMTGGKDMFNWTANSNRTPMGWVSYVHGL